MTFKTGRLRVIAYIEDESFPIQPCLYSGLKNRPPSENEVKAAFSNLKVKNIVSAEGQKNACVKSTFEESKAKVDSVTYT